MLLGKKEEGVHRPAIHPTLQPPGSILQRSYHRPPRASSCTGGRRGDRRTEGQCPRSANSVSWLKQVSQTTRCKKKQTMPLPCLQKTKSFPKIGGRSQESVSTPPSHTHTHTHTHTNPPAAKAEPIPTSG
ncbi:UNVERIFIED_CONTAM: hypothetical protein K2H54_013291 [Gekko kuhli]